MPTPQQALGGPAPVIDKSWFHLYEELFHVVGFSGWWRWMLKYVLSDSARYNF